MSRALIAFLASALLGSCTSSSKSGVSESTQKACTIGANDLPILVVLSSTVLGGKNAAIPRGPYAGDVPPAFVLYQNNQVLFAKNISKSASPFYGYFCTRLSDEQRAEIVGAVINDMPETFAGLDSQDRGVEPGINQLIAFRGEFECSQYEIKGSLNAAKLFGQRSRSSVAPRVPDAIMSTFEKLTAFTPSSRPSPWFPDRALLEFRQLTDKEATSARATAVPWPQSLPLTKINPKEFRIQPAAKVSYYTTPISAAKMKEFSNLLRAPVIRDQKTFIVGYRFALPHDRLWAAPYPSLSEEYSVCNRFISRQNFGKLYGLNYFD